jgi:hypothetical protein
LGPNKSNTERNILFFLGEFLAAKRPVIQMELAMYRQNYKTLQGSDEMLT